MPETESNLEPEQKPEPEPVTPAPQDTTKTTYGFMYASGSNWSCILADGSKASVSNDMIGVDPGDSEQQYLIVDYIGWYRVTVLGKVVQKVEKVPQSETTNSDGLAQFCMFAEQGDRVNADNPSIGDCALDRNTVFIIATNDPLGTSIESYSIKMGIQNVNVELEGILSDCNAFVVHDATYTGRYVLLMGKNIQSSSGSTNGFTTAVAMTTLSGLTDLLMQTPPPFFTF